MTKKRYFAQPIPAPFKEEESSVLSSFLQAPVDAASVEGGSIQNEGGSIVGDSALPAAEATEVVDAVITTTEGDNTATTAVDGEATQPMVDAPVAQTFENIAIADLLGEASLSESALELKTYDTTPLAHISKWCPQYGLAPESIESLPSSSVPKEELILNWVYGFSSRLTRSSVKYDANNLIVYPAATFVVIYDKVANKQTYFTGHDDTVTALEYNPAANIFASGQRRANGEAVIVCVWSYTDSVATLQRINCGAVNAVSSLAFNNDGSLLAVSCMDDKHSIQVYDWRSGVLKGKISTGAKKPLCLAFSADSTLNSFRLLEGGVLHFNLLEGRNADFVSSKFGIFGAKKVNVLCCAALPLAVEGGNEFVVGLSNGNLGVVSRGDRRFSNSPASGMTSVTAIHVVRVKEATTEEPNPIFKVIIAGSKGLIKVLDQEFAPTAEFDIYKSVPDLSVLGKERGIKSIFVDKLARKILFGTSGGEISELDITTGATMAFESTQPLITSHCKDQTFAVDVHPIRQECITGGDDKTLRIWDLENKTLISMIQLQDIVRTVAFSPNGQIVVAGLGGATRRGNEWQDRVNEADSTKVRSLVVLSYLQNKLQVVYEALEPTDAITCVAFSPDQRSLFVGSRDKNIYVYDPLNDFQCTDILKGHVEPIRSFDISGDMKFLISQGDDVEVLAWDLNEAKKVPKEKQLSVIKKASCPVRSNTYGLDSMGVFPVSSPFDPVRTLSRSGNAMLLASGNHDGAIKLFSYPSTRPSAPYKEYKGHSQEGVAKVLFTLQDKYLVSLGRDDRVLLQWSVLQDNIPIAARIQPVGFKFDSLTTVDESDMKQFNICAAGDMYQIVSSLGVNSSITTAGAVYCGQGSIAIPTGNFPVLLSSAGFQQPIVNSPVNRKTVTSISRTYDGKLISMCEGLIPDSGASPETFYGSLYVVNASSAQIVARLSPTLGSAVAGVVEWSEGFIGGITKSVFSKDGKYLAAISGDIYNSLFVFHSASGLWTDSYLTFSGPVDTARIDLIVFYSQDSGIGPNSDSVKLVTGGSEANGGLLKFWKVYGRNASMFQPGSLLNSAVFTPKATALCNIGSNLVCSGGGDGSVSVFSGSDFTVDTLELNTLTTVHTSAVTAISSCSVDYSNIFITASNDVISIYNGLWSYPTIISIQSDILRPIGRGYDGYGTPFVTSLDTDLSAKRVLATLSTNLVVEISVDSKIANIITEGNARESGVGDIKPIGHPIEDHTLVTLQKANKSLKVWDLFYSNSLNPMSTTPSLVEVLPLPHPPTTGTFNNSGSVFALALTNADSDGASGKIILMKYDLSRKDRRFSVNTRETDVANKQDNAIFTIVKAVHNIGKGDIQCLRFSTDEAQSLLFAASQDRKIYFMSASNDYLTIGALDCAMYYEQNFLGSPSLLFDFSESAKQIRVASGVLEEAMSVQYFDITVPDKEMQRPATNITTGIETSWGSISVASSEDFSSFAVPTEFTSYYKAELASIISKGSGAQNSVCGFSNGFVSFSRGPNQFYYAAHAAGAPVEAVYLGDGSNYIATCSASDGTVIVWRQF